MDRPKRPKTAYLLYYTDVLKDYQTEEYNNESGNPDLTKISKAIGLSWKDADSEVKEKYTSQAKKDRERYEEELAAFKEEQENEKFTEAEEPEENDDSDDDNLESLSSLGAHGDINKPGVVGLNQIQNFPRSGDLIIPKVKFQRIVREVGQEYLTEVKYRSGAEKLLQEACETYVLGLLHDAKDCAEHAKRNTVMARDIQIARRIRNESQSYY